MFSLKVSFFSEKHAFPFIFYLGTLPIEQYIASFLHLFTPLPSPLSHLRLIANLSRFCRNPHHHSLENEQSAPYIYIYMYMTPDALQEN